MSAAKKSRKCLTASIHNLTSNVQEAKFLVVELARPEAPCFFRHMKHVSKTHRFFGL